MWEEPQAKYLAYLRHQSGKLLRLIVSACLMFYDIRIGAFLN